MGKGLFALTWIGLVLLGFGFGSGFLPREAKRGAQMVSGISPEKEFSPVELKSFAIVLYAHNDVDWCERSLRSIFEQDYESFRLIFIDDGSHDATFDTVQRFILENQQQHRALLIRNASPVGFLPSLYRAVQHCLDREVVVPLLAKDWFANPSALLCWSRAFQNPDVWIALGRTIRYPSHDFLDPLEWDAKEVAKYGYRVQQSLAHCFYSALFKQLSVQSLLGLPADYLESMLELSGGRIKNVWDPIAFRNESVAPPEDSALQRIANAPEPPKPPKPPKPLEPLAAFPKCAGAKNEPRAQD